MANPQKKIGGYSVDQLRAMMSMEQRSLRQHIAKMQAEMSVLQRDLHEATRRLHELERAEDLLD